MFNGDKVAGGLSFVLALLLTGCNLSTPLVFTSGGPAPTAVSADYLGRDIARLGEDITQDVRFSLSNQTDLELITGFHPYFEHHDIGRLSLSTQLTGFSYYLSEDEYVDSSDVFLASTVPTALAIAPFTELTFSQHPGSVPIEGFETLADGTQQTIDTANFTDISEVIPPLFVPEDIPEDYYYLLIQVDQDDGRQATNGFVLHRFWAGEGTDIAHQRRTPPIIEGIDGDIIGQPGERLSDITLTFSLANRGNETAFLNDFKLQLHGCQGSTICSPLGGSLPWRTQPLIDEVTPLSPGSTIEMNVTLDAFSIPDDLAAGSICMRVYIDVPDETIGGSRLLNNMSTCRLLKVGRTEG